MDNIIDYVRIENFDFNKLKESRSHILILNSNDIINTKISLYIYSILSYDYRFAFISDRQKMVNIERINILHEFKNTYILNKYDPEILKANKPELSNMTKLVLFDCDFELYPPSLITFITDAFLDNWRIIYTSKYISNLESSVIVYWRYVILTKDILISEMEERLKWREIDYYCNYRMIHKYFMLDNIITEFYFVSLLIQLPDDMAIIIDFLDSKIYSFIY